MEDIVSAAEAIIDDSLVDFVKPIAELVGALLLSCAFIWIGYNYVLVFLDALIALIKGALRGSQ